MCSLDKCFIIQGILWILLRMCSTYNPILSLKTFWIFVSLLYSLDMNFIDNSVVSHKIKHALNNFFVVKTIESGTYNEYRFLISLNIQCIDDQSQ